MDYHLLPQFRPARLQDLVLWYEPWSFRGRTWRNLAPNYSDRNHGTAHGGVGLSTWHPQFSPAPIFDGVDDYVEVPDSDSLDITSEITVSAWVNWNNITFFGPKGRIVAKWDSFDTWILELADDGNYKFWIDTNGGIENAATATGVETGVWHHIVGTYNNSAMKIYIDGNLENMSIHSSSGDITVNNHAIFIGVSENLKYYINGIIGEVCIYKAALAPAEVMHNYTHHPLYYLQRGIDPYMFIKKGGIYYVM